MKQLFKKIGAFIAATAILFAAMMPGVFIQAFAQTEDSLRLSVISDLHYYPVSYTGNENSAYKEYEKGNMRLIGENSAATSAAVDMILADAPDVVMVTGDLTNDGEKQSAIELAALLQTLENDGIKVYVINGNHDINSGIAGVNSGTPVSFESGQKQTVSNISPSEFREIFRNFGYDGEDSASYYQSLNTQDADAVQGGLSYIVTPKPGYKIIMIDSEVYTPDYLGASKGMLSPKLLEWAVGKLDQAAANGDVVVGGMHHPLLNHFGNDYSAQLFETIDNSKIAAERFANANLKYIFTGHMHGNDIATYASRKGNQIADIETGAIGGMGSPVRSVTVTRDNIEISSKSVSQIFWGGQTIDYQAHLRSKVLSDSLTTDLADKALVDNVVDMLTNKGIHNIIEELVGIDIKNTLESALIDMFAETQEFDASVGKLKIQVRGAGSNDPYLHMWGTGAMALLSDYDVSIRRNIFNGVDNLLVTQVNNLWLTPDANGQTRLERAFHQVIKDVEAVILHTNGITLGEFLKLTLESGAWGAESAPDWVLEIGDGLKITLMRKIAKEALIPSLKTNLINPILDEMYLDINETFPSKGIYRDAIGYVLGGSVGKQKIPLRYLVQEHGDLNVDAEISELVEKYIDNDSDISMAGNPISQLAMSQWIDSKGDDDKINGAGVTMVIPDADPNAVAEIEYKSLNLGVGSSQNEMYVTWYSTSAMDARVQLAKKIDAPSGTELPKDISLVSEFTGVIEETPTIEYTSNKVAITGLEENTDYLYRIGNEGDWSEVFSFRTGGYGDGWGFIFSGDAQIGSTGSIEDDTVAWNSSLGLITKKHPEASFILSIGDQVNTADSEPEYDGLLENVFMKSYRLSTVVGNHDDDSVLYSTHFTNPNAQRDGGVSGTGKEAGNYWYKYNNALFIMLNSNNSNAQEHIDFVRRVNAEQGAGVDWKVVGFHHSIYSVANHSKDANLLSLRAKISPVFSEIGIDVVLMGHDHSYARTFMMDGVTPQRGEVSTSIIDPPENQVLYVTANSSASKHYTMEKEVYDYVAVRNQEGLDNISYVEITKDSFRIVTYRTELEDRVPLTAETLSIMDEFTIKRSGVTKADINAPVLKIPSDSVLTVAQAAAFDPKAGVSSYDDIDGDLSADVIVENTVNSHRDGVYKLIYTATDNAGNSAVAVRFITVTGNHAEVKFDSNGGTDVAPVTGLALGSLVEKPSNPSREGYTFGGWYADAELKTPWHFDTDAVYEEITLYAAWNIITLTVSFNTLGGGEISDTTADYGATIAKPVTPIRNGYAFDGWYLEENLETEWDFDTKTVKNDTTLYARWIEIEESIVVFDPANGNDYHYFIGQTGNAVDKPAEPVREGYLFAGWYTERDGGELWDFEHDIMRQSETFLYARWNYVYYLVSFNTGGAGELASQQIIKGETISKPAALNKTGYRFLGWYSDELFTEAWDFETDQVNKDTTLYANWAFILELEVDEISDVYVPEGRDLNISVQASVTSNEEISYILKSALPEGAAMDGNHFKWENVPTGAYAVTIEVSASGLSKNVSFHLYVSANTAPPVMILSDIDDMAIDATLVPEALALRLTTARARLSTLLSQNYIPADEVEAITEELGLIASALEKVIDARQALSDALSRQADALSNANSTMFIGNAWFVYQAARTSAQAALSSSLTEDDVKAALQDLKDAYDVLLSKERKLQLAGLQMLLDSIEDFKEEDYTPASWQKLQQPAVLAKALIASPRGRTQEEVNQYATDISQAVSLLTKVSDLSGYIKTIKSLLAFNSSIYLESDYTPESFAAYQNAMSALQAYVDSYEGGNSNITLNELTHAVNALNSAVSALEVVVIDPRDAMIDALEALKKSMEALEKIYTSATQAQLDAANAAAADIISDYRDGGSERTIEEITEVAKSITTAFNGLKLQAQEDLEAAIREATLYMPKGYTPDSYQRLQAALDAAEALLAGEQSPTIQEMNDARKVLGAAISQLENLKLDPEEPKKTDPVSYKPEESKNDNATSPSTGEKSIVPLFTISLTAILVLSGAVIIRRKSKEQ